MRSAAALLRAKASREPDEWADQSRVQPQGSPEPGQWRTDRTPYMRRPQREANRGRRRRVVIVCGSQLSKTESLLNIAGHRLEDDPTPVLFVSPTRSNAEKVIEPRFMQMLNSAEGLRRLYAAGKASSKTKKRIGNVSFRLAWAGSATELASDPAGLALVDEIDRMKLDVAGEGGVLEQVKARLSNYPDGCMVVTSTPKTGNLQVEINPETGLEQWALVSPDELHSPIWREWQEGTRHEWAWPCPACSEYFVPRLRHLRWPQGSTPQQAMKLAKVHCPRCDHGIEDGYKDSMNAAGVFVAPGQMVLTSGVVVGEEPDNPHWSGWISGLCSPWVSFGERAYDYLKAVRSGDKLRVQAVVNTAFGELFANTGDAPEYEVVQRLVGGYTLGQVPSAAIVIGMTVDVQKDRLFYVVRAWGEKRASWLIDRGEIMGQTDQDDVWDELETYRYRSYGDLPISYCWIDSGYRPGDKFKRPDNVIYAFGRKHVGWAYITKGHDKQEKPIRASLIDVTLRGKTYKQGLTLWHIDGDTFKSWVYSRLEWPEEQAGRWLVPDDIDIDYCRQVVSESRVVKPSGHVKWVRLRKANHYLDCEMLQAAAAEHFKFQQLVWRAMKTNEVDPEMEAMAELGKVLGRG